MNSAKGKARRGNRWVFPVVLLFSALVCLLGAAGIRHLYSPSEYSEREVGEYVRSIYGDSWTLQKKTALSQERGGGTRYLYASGKKGSFSVFTLSVPVYKNGLPTGRWAKALSDNYFSTLIEKNMDELKKLGEDREDPDVRFEIEKTGDSSGAYSPAYSFRIYLESGSCLEEAADLLAEADEILSFACRKGEPPYNAMRRKTPAVYIYLKPEKSGPAADALSQAAPSVKEGESRKVPDLTADWSSEGEREKYRISTIPFTDASAASRLRKGEVLARLENDYVDKAKTSGKSIYAAPSGLKDKYPAPVLTLTNVGGHDMRTAGEGKKRYQYQFLYHRETGTYWLTGLDPCEDFEGNPFGNYARRGAFSALVKALGGTFRCDDWKGEWKIGDNRWTASEETVRAGRKPYTHKRMSLFRNGNNEILDEVPELFEGTGAVPSGRPFSIRDLIRLLDVRITINQKDMTAVMFRNF